MWAREGKHAVVELGTDVVGVNLARQAEAIVELAGAPGAAPHDPVRPALLGPAVSIAARDTAQAALESVARDELAVAVAEDGASTGSLNRPPGVASSVLGEV